jgi:hypothetical protein
MQNLFLLSFFLVSSTTRMFNSSEPAIALIMSVLLFIHSSLSASPGGAPVKAVQ